MPVREWFVPAAKPHVVAGPLVKKAAFPRLHVVLPWDLRPEPVLDGVEHALIAPFRVWITCNNLQRSVDKELEDIVTVARGAVVVRGGLRPGCVAKFHGTVNDDRAVTVGCNHDVGGGGAAEVVHNAS